jgi:hypothetical protein
MLEDYLRNMVEPILTEPDSLKLTRTQDDMGVLVTIDVSKNDMGRIIGRNGETAKAIRTLMRVVGSMHQSRVAVKINEPEGSTRGHHAELNQALEGITSKPINGQVE